jgi:tetratricopeptide (TPR) repeat protein
VNEAERHFIVAAEAMYSGRLDEAIDQLELLLALDPDDFWGAFRLAHAYLAAGRVGDSLRLREHCARLRPDHFLNFSESGFTRLFAAGDLEGAGEDYQRVLALDPEHPFAIPYLLPSFQAWLARDLTRARRLLDRVLDRNMEGFLPLGRTSALVHDARFRLFTGDAAGAVAQLRFGVEGTTPGSTLHGWVRIELALTLRDLGDRPGFLAEMAGVENGGTPLNRAQAWLWLALDAVRAGERGRARTLAATLRSMAIPETSEFGYPIGRIVDRVRRVYPTLIEGESSLASGDARSAVDRFSEAVEVLPLALDAPVPLSTTGPRVHLAAREGLARALAAAGKAREAEDAESWLVRHRLQLFVTSRAGVGLWLGALARRAALLVARGRRADATRDAGQVIACWGRLEPRPEPVMAAQRVLDGLRRRSSTPPVAAGTGLSSRRVR